MEECEVRLRLLGFLVGMVAVAAVGCSGGEKLLERSVDQMREVESLRSESVSEIESFGSDFQAVMAIAVDRDGNFNSVVSTGGGQFASETKVTVVDDYVFVELPGPGWVRASLDDPLFGSSAPARWLRDPVGFYGAVFPEGDVPWSKYTIVELEAEEIDGIETTHFSVGFDVLDVAEAMATEQQNLLVGLFGGDPFADAVPFAFEVWIDESGYSRQVLMEVTDDVVGVSKTTIRMWDFDEDIPVVAPSPFTDLAELGG
jgi:hypothetical protein